eukprot:IDg2457t1
MRARPAPLRPRPFFFFFSVRPLHYCARVPHARPVTRTVRPRAAPGYAFSAPRRWTRSRARVLPLSYYTVRPLRTARVVPPVIIPASLHGGHTVADALLSSPLHFLPSRQLARNIKSPHFLSAAPRPLPDARGPPTHLHLLRICSPRRRREIEITAVCCHVGKSRTRPPTVAYMSRHRRKAECHCPYLSANVLLADFDSARRVERQAVEFKGKYALLKFADAVIAESLNGKCLNFTPYYRKH